VLPVRALTPILAPVVEARGGCWLFVIDLHLILLLGPKCDLQAVQPSAVRYFDLNPFKDNSEFSFQVFAPSKPHLF